MIYAPPGTTTAPKMSLEFMQGDTLIARGTPALAAPDKDGRIQFVGTIPIENVKPASTACAPWRCRAKTSRNPKRP